MGLAGGLECTVTPFTKKLYHEWTECLLLQKRDSTECVLFPSHVLLLLFSELCSQENIIFQYFDSFNNVSCILCFFLQRWRFSYFLFLLWLTWWVFYFLKIGIFSLFNLSHMIFFFCNGSNSTVLKFELLVIIIILLFRSFLIQN